MASLMLFEEIGRSRMQFSQVTLATVRLKFLPKMKIQTPAGYPSSAESHLFIKPTHLAQVSSWIRASGLVCAVLAVTASVTTAGVLTLYSTSVPSAWLVSVNTGQGDADNFSNPNVGVSNFLTSSGAFSTAVAVSGRADYIAGNSSGSTGYMGYWTQYVFRQQFDLTGFDPTTASLQLTWAADDIGNPTGAAARGRWLPVFKLNGGAFNSGGIGTGDAGYSLSTANAITLTSGFVAGLNTIDFYVQGNGQTDGFALTTVGLRGLTATPVGTPPGGAVPDAGTTLMLMLGAAGATAALSRFLKK